MVPGKKEQLIWIFEAEEIAPDGRPYEHAVFTGLFYGDSRANLTTLLDMLLPKATDDEKKSLNTDLLLGSRYDAVIRMVKNQKNNLVPKAVDLSPVVADK